MAIIANRVKIKSYISESFHVLLYSIRKLAIVIFLILALFVVFFNYVSLSKTTLEASGRSSEISSRAYELLIEPFEFLSEKVTHYKKLDAENERLKQELVEIRALHEQAIVATSENENLKKLLQIVPQSFSKPIAVKLLNVIINPFASSATIAAGEHEGMRVNDYVVADFGLLGRLVEVSAHYSTIMLVDDYNSRIPVITAKSGVRAIAARQDNKIKLIYPESIDVMEKGEIVYTSGDGKIFPDGIKVGYISEIDGDEVTVSLLRDLRGVKYVLVYSLRE